MVWTHRLFSFIQVWENFILCSRDSSHTSTKLIIFNNALDKLLFEIPQWINMYFKLVQLQTAPLIDTSCVDKHIWAERFHFKIIQLQSSTVLCFNWVFIMITTLCAGCFAGLHIFCNCYSQCCLLHMHWLGGLAHSCHITLLLIICSFWTTTWAFCLGI